MPRLSRALFNQNYWNFPKKFIERQMRLGENLGHYVDAPLERPPELRIMGESLPWNDDWARENYPEPGMMPGKGHSHHYEQAWRELPAVEPVKEMIFFKGDRVECQVGKDKGRVGVVRQLIEARNWCYVEGINSVYEYGPEMVTKKERPLLTTTQVKLVDPLDEKGCEAEWRFTEEGERVRVSLRSGREIPIPQASLATIDYMQKENYKHFQSAKNTTAEVVEVVTYEPHLKSVAEDILDSMGIKDEKKRGQTFWY